MNLLRCLLQDILFSRLYRCSTQNMSFFQGQTLGVFVSDCLVLMQDKYENVYNLGKWFFESLNVECVHQKISFLGDSQASEGTRFGAFGNLVINSAVWRGFIKGLMSNPIIEEVWPNAFI